MHHCGNVITKLTDKGVPVMCCGEAMTELIPGTSDGAAEKHVPVYTVDGDKGAVTIGAVEHPMVDVHYIEWIALQTTSGIQFRYLKPGDAPKAEFVMADGEEFEAVYAYCNLHGLWNA